MFLFLSRFYNLAVAFAVAAERSIDTIIVYADARIA